MPRLEMPPFTTEFTIRKVSLFRDAQFTLATVRSWKSRPYRITPLLPPTWYKKEPWKTVVTAVDIKNRYSALYIGY